MTRILIVDDIVQNRYLLESLLKGHGFEVVSASNGEQALEEAGRSRPDLVIADILMPVMDGFELCRRWKADVNLRPIPFIFYTGTYTDLKDEQFALSLGAERYIVKPAKPDVLMRNVNEVLDEASKGRMASLPSSNDNASLLKEYNEVLFHKLEKKVMDLEANIAQLKATENALRESEERFRKVFDSGILGIALLDADGRLSLFNQEFSRMLGFFPEELAEQGLLELSHPDHRPLLRESLEGLKDGKMVLFTSENRFVRKDRSVVWANTRISIITDQDGRFSLFITFVTDITDRKIMEENERKALTQIEENLKQLATLNDQIRNPLAIIVARIMKEENMVGADQILAAVRSIDEMVTHLDEKWAESAKVREFLLRYNQVSRR